jgi:hypothetical protein
MAIDDGISESVVELIERPRCKECRSKKGVKPAVHSYKGPYYCIECCNYIDKEGKLINL